MNLKNLAIIAFSLFTLASCSSEKEGEPVAIQNKEISTTDFNKLLNSVDSLNACYSSPNVNNRCAITTGVGVVAADAAGGALGGFLGSYLGGGLGSLTGNPFGTIIGYVGGRSAGKYIGQILASHIASMKLSTEGYIKDTLLPNNDYDLSIATASSLEDSIGYIHNALMVKMNQDKEKYVQNGIINYDLIYSDCINYCKDYGIYDEAFVLNNTYKDKILDFTKKSTLICEKNISGLISNETLINMQCDLMKTNFNVDDETIKIYKDFGGKVIEQCSKLDKIEIKEYSKELNTVIQDSNLPIIQKENISSTAQIVINSSICWKE